jgi:two-component system, chemotaxis family, sensor kinase CheA
VIRRKAVEKGFLSTEQANSMRNRDLLQLICRPGFSTASQVTDTSGRGVGMDVVKSAVENLGGLLEIASLPGRGTRLRLKLPLSIAIIQILLVEVHGQTLGIPITKVLRTMVIRGGEIRAVGRQLTIGIEEVREGGEKVEISVPLLSLRKALRLPARAHPGTIPVILTEALGRKVGLVVDRFVGQREVFVKSLAFPLDRLSGITGATVLGDGRVIFLIDPHALLEDPAPSTPPPPLGDSS